MEIHEVGVGKYRVVSDSGKSLAVYPTKKECEDFVDNEEIMQDLRDAKKNKATDVPRRPGRPKRNVTAEGSDID